MVQGKEQSEKRKGGARGLYVHVPFCVTRCDFCAFYEKQPESGEIAAYLEGVRQEWEYWRGQGAESLDTVFWGGGTPGILPARDLMVLGECVHEATGGVWQEWTVEMAPATVTATKAKALRSLGVTRISMGVQSLQEPLLDALGRQHTREQVYRAYDVLRGAGFDNINLDLMFALPGQSWADWQLDLDEVVAMGPEHISTYCLTFEEDTALYVQLQRGKVTRSVEKEADFYEGTWAYLAQAGFGQYEVSNFAREGFPCIHNVNTWKMSDWLGLGPSAASQWRGHRRTGVPSLTDWLAGVRAGSPVYQEEQLLDAADLLEDALIFGLRLNEGVDLAALARRFGGEPVAVYHALWEELLADELLVRRGERVALTVAGRLLADGVGARVMDYRVDEALSLQEGAR